MSKTQLWVGGVFIIYFVAFFVAPIVPYRASVSIPGAGYASCFQAGTPATDSLTTSQETGCLNGYALPAVGITSYSTPEYRTFGYGQAPFQSVEAVSTGNRSALLFFRGSTLLAAEAVDSPSVRVNPPLVVEFDEVPVFSSDFGFINITIMIRNVGYYSIQDPTVYLSMAGFSSNQTIGGLTWMQPRIIGGCPAVWLPSDYCTVTQVVQNNLPVNKSFSYYAEVRGYNQGDYFVYRQGYSEAYPAGGIGPAWIDRFVAQLDKDRPGGKLNESAALDSFASLRFRDAAANFSISDYGFERDVARVWGNTTNPAVAELLLFPGRNSPTSYATFLSSHAPIHWNALVNPAFTEYGYYVGHAPYYEVELPCAVYEIPGQGINITHYFQSQGCRTIIEPEATWLVIIMSD